MIPGKLRSCIFVESKPKIMAEQLVESETDKQSIIENSEFITIEHFFCLDHTSTRQIHQSIKVNYFGDEDVRFDIGLRTKSIVEEELTLFTDDSLNLMERHFYSEKYAKTNMKMNFLQEESIIGINQYPCISGLAMSGQQEGTSIGVSVSHPVTCSHQSQNTFELLVYRFQSL